MSIERFLSALTRLRRRVFKRKEDGRIKERLEVLRSASVFADLRSSHLAIVAEVMHERRFRRDEFVYFEGDPGLGLYLIRQGGVKLTRRDENEEEVEIAVLGESDVFGVLSLFEDLRRVESARSVADTVVYGLFRPDLTAMSNRNPAAAANVYRALGRHVGRLYSSLLVCLEDRFGRTSTLEMLSGASGTGEATNSF
ncbi:MAG: cyclic nucleotide-binding domain-containing protein [Rhodothermales bacterium]|nr:cyclic nucleotide-binding domain-containing protein [Rhodothermales bacterium]